MNPACVPSATSSRSPLFRGLRRAVVAFLIFVLAAILAPVDFPSATAAGSEVSPLVTLAKIREAWVQDLRTKKLEPILMLYAPDAAFLQPTGERIAGSAALRTLFQTIMATFNSDLTLNSKNLETSGDLAYDSGDFEETLTNIASGARISSKGSYVIIYKRQSNGRWQIVQHVWTGIPPAST
jgi:ketosteroid isomerase-like protein